MNEEVLVISFDEIWEMVYELYKKIKSSDFTPDVIVAITRGGFVPSRIISDLLGIKYVTTIGVEFYTNINETLQEPKLTGKFCYKVKNKKVLLIDDVSDTGKSLEFVLKYLKKKKVKDIKTATIHYKPKSIFKPDFYIGETSNWIVYPWERIEFARDYYIRRTKENIPHEAIFLELEKFGLPEIAIKEADTN
ncbi:MAG: phosphoribosyltransferase [Asgard group archaeon]|nr:phosphoribosyltransferase [Asgard group archaeon]